MNYFFSIFLLGRNDDFRDDRHTAYDSDTFVSGNVALCNEAMHRLVCSLRLTNMATD